MNLDVIIESERTKLKKLIEDNADYNVILKQSQKLDKLIVKKIKQGK